MKLKSHLDQTQFAFATPAPGESTDLKAPVDLWHAPAVIAENNFVHKSLSNWAFSVAVGCTHACRFCYVPDAATIKQGPQLATYGVRDADAEWGKYLLLRPWNETKFLASLRAAENTPRTQLKPDGNRAVITTVRVLKASHRIGLVFIGLECAARGVCDLNYLCDFPPAGSPPSSPDARRKTRFCPTHRLDPLRTISPLCAPL